jgi:ariadne-1
MSAGTEALIRCRRVLAYTYVYAFYLPRGSPEQNIFEYLQEDLESTVEKLSRQLEDMGKEFDMSKKRQIIDLTALGLRRLQNLLNGVEEGLTVSRS